MLYQRYYDRRSTIMKCIKCTIHTNTVYSKTKIVYYENYYNKIIYVTLFKNYGNTCVMIPKYLCNKCNTIITQT